MHNGLIREFPRLRRELVLAIDDSLFDSIEGTTDSETMFYLALTFGLENDPVAAVERMVGFVEDTGHRHGIEQPIQMTIATTDGRSVYAFRYSSEGQSRSLYFSTRMDALKALHPESGEQRASRRRRPRRHHPAGPRRATTVRATPMSAQHRT
jgi:glutamine amidotransferase